MMLEEVTVGWVGDGAWAGGLYSASLREEEGLLSGGIKSRVSIPDESLRSFPSDELDSSMPPSTTMTTRTTALVIPRLNESANT
jgi:hypothetical protein